MSDQITARIQRAELLGLLHATLEHERVTKPIVAPPLLRAPRGTGEVVPVDGVVDDDIEPELNIAISRITTMPEVMMNPTIEAAIDAAVEAAGEQAVAEIDRETAVIATPRQHPHLWLMIIGFFLSVVFGLSLTLAICSHLGT